LCEYVNSDGGIETAYPNASEIATPSYVSFIFIKFFAHFKGTKINHLRMAALFRMTH